MTGDKHEDESKDPERIRVLSDQDEVGLEASEKKPGVKMTPSREAWSMDRMLNEDKIFSNPEGEWQSEDWKSRAPMGWFVLLGIVFLGLLSWSIITGSFRKKGRADVTDKDGQGTATYSSSIGPTASREEVNSAIDFYSRLEMVVIGFLYAKTIEDRAWYIRHPKRVKPLMEDYYKDHEFERFDFRSITSFRSFELENRPFIAVVVETEKGPISPLLIEDLPDGMKVDWETSVSYQPVTLVELIRERPTESVTLRVYATPDNFFAYEFQEFEYLGFKLTERHSREWVFGYAKLGSEVAEKFQKLMINPAGGLKKMQPVLIKARYLPGSRAPRSVMIDEIVSTTWAYVDDPSKEE